MIQIIENIARGSLVFLNQLVAVRIAERSGDDLNQVDQCPYSAATNCENLNDADNGVSGIESVYSKASGKDTEQKGGEPVLAITVNDWGILFDLYSAGWTNYSFGIDFFSTICAVHVFLL